jgi:antitoxin ParD1/3/4
MNKMNISMPDSPGTLVDLPANQSGDSTPIDYVREPVGRDQARGQLRVLIIDGAKSSATGEADARYFARLRERVAASQAKGGKAKTAARR